MDTYVYEYGKNLYINLTNRCTNNCTFCVRNDKDGVTNDTLWIKKEPETQDIMDQLVNFDIAKYPQIVFCGYGEPMMKLDVLLESAKLIKEKYGSVTRINSNGQANLYFGEDITPKLEGLIDIMSISLNHSSPEEYNRICKSKFGIDAFVGVIDFANKCKKYVPKVKLSIVDILPQEVQDQCQKIADEIDVELLIRKYIE